MSLLGSTQHLGDVHSAPEELQVLLQLVRLVSAVEDGQLWNIPMCARSKPRE